MNIFHPAFWHEFWQDLSKLNEPAFYIGLVLIAVAAIVTAVRLENTGAEPQ